MLNHADILTALVRGTSIIPLHSDAIIDKLYIFMCISYFHLLV